MDTKRKRDAPPGDIRVAPLNVYVGEQPISEDEKMIVRRGYDLFHFFRDKLRPEHDEMMLARSERALRNDNRPITSPPGNTMNSCIDNIIADQIDNMPSALLIPEKEETAKSAEEMSDVVAYVLYQARWPETYQVLMEDAAVTGTGIAEVFWDDTADDGEGMVNIIPWHPEDFYPDPMYEDIQDGRAVFKATRTTVAWVQAHYPDAAQYVRADASTLPEEDYTDPFFREAPEGDEPVTLLEYWYKRYENGRTHVHMAQMAGGALLYSTETGFGIEGKGEARAFSRDGVYAHGQYPFTMFRYRRVWRRPFGTGLNHDYRDTQDTINRYFKYIDDNARMSSKQRHFIRKGSGVNADEVADMSRDVIEWEGNDINEVMQTVQANPLNSQVYQAMNYLVDVMKQDCGQNQFTRGEGGLGITAASAIQALQEAGGKLTRWHTESFKNSFRFMVDQILYVLSEYLDSKRVFKIVGDWDGSGTMQDRLVQLLIPKAEGDKLPKPAYTVRVQVQKNNPLQIQSDNEFLLQIAQIAAQSGQSIPAEAIVNLMEGYRTKPSVLRMLRETSQQQQMMQQMQAQNEQLAQQLEQQKQVSNSYLKALTSTGNEIMQDANESAWGNTGDNTMKLGL